ncbi:hypothetical protein B296_00026548 [Ensete ventricosum]|uniref:Uncharacterized protein n=1 Tax=Ensete ventricosum TaxID=4639 RepID=A0A427A915_ENSVE|nr:hypothetical protein B296_00026548 [Ensete ventricosum]
MLASLRRFSSLGRALPLSRPSLPRPTRPLLRPPTLLPPLARCLAPFSLFSTTAPFDGVAGGDASPYAVSEVDQEPASHRSTDAYAAIELALDSVVKVFTVSSSPNYFLPWQNKAQRESMGSADHTFVLVRKHGSPTKYKAEIQAVGHECDLALLTVDSKEFWDGMNFLELGDIPYLQEAVAVVGYPQVLARLIATPSSSPAVDLTAVARSCFLLCCLAAPLACRHCFTPQLQPQLPQTPTRLLLFPYCRPPSPAATLPFPVVADFTILLPSLLPTSSFPAPNPTSATFVTARSCCSGRLPPVARSLVFGPTAAARLPPSTEHLYPQPHLQLPLHATTTVVRSPLSNRRERLCCQQPPPPCCNLLTTAQHPLPSLVPLLPSLSTVTALYFSSASYDFPPHQPPAAHAVVVLPCCSPCCCHLLLLRPLLLALAAHPSPIAATETLLSPP